MLKRLFVFFLLSSSAIVCAGVSPGDRIISDGQRVVIRGGRVSIESLSQRRKELGKRFFYFETKEGRFVVRDHSTIERVFALYEPSRSARVAMKEAIHRQRELSKRERELAREIDRIENALEDEHSDQSELELRHIELEAEARELERESERLEELGERFERELEAHEEVAEAQLERMIQMVIKKGLARRLEP